MEANPNEVVTILLVNSDNATPTELHAEFTEAQITDLAFKPDSSTVVPTEWPTLQTLISARKRLMVFVASLDLNGISAEQMYLMDEFTFIFENPFENTSPSDFTCNPDRPNNLKDNVQAAVSSGRMAFMNHFLYQSGALDIETPNVDNITTTNGPNTTAVGMLGQSLNTCQQAYGKAPTFVLVDFFDQGPAIKAVDAINGITPTGRITLPARDTDSSRAESSFEAVTALVEQVQEGKTPTRGAWIYAGGAWTLGGINLSGGDLVS